MCHFEEWLAQAEYDIDTAEYMLKGSRNMYAVFMCHLAVEKALKGLLTYKTDRIPPKTHNLGFLLKETGLACPEDMRIFLTQLSDASVTTRYPANLIKMQASYPESLVSEIVLRAKGVIEWIKHQL